MRLDGQRQSSAQGVYRVAESEHLRESVAKAAGNRRHNLRGIAVIVEYIGPLIVDAADALSHVLTDQREVGQDLVLGLRDAHIVDVEIHAGSFQLRPAGEGFVDFPLGVVADGIEGQIDSLGHLNGQFANDRVKIHTHLAAQRVLHQRQRIARLRHAQLSGGKLLLGVVDIERRDGAQLQLLLRKLERFIRQFAGALLHTKVLARLHHIPIGVFGGVHGLQQISF